MRKYLLILILPAFFLIAFQQRAKALGVGLYGGFNYSEHEFEDIDSNYTYEQLHYWVGGGLVVDTAVAKKKIFNYRLNLGIGMLTETATDQDYNDGENGFRLDIINSFGFGIVKVPFMRLWLGPQLGLRIDYIDYEVSSLKIEKTRLILLPGAVLGFNFNIGSFFTIGIDGGFRYNLGLQFLSYGSSILDDRSYTDIGPEGFVNLSIIFRINDTYGNKKSKSRSEDRAQETSSEKKENSKGEKVSDDDDYWFGD